MGVFGYSGICVSEGAVCAPFAAIAALIAASASTGESGSPFGTSPRRPSLLSTQSCPLVASCDKFSARRLFRDAAAEPVTMVAHENDAMQGLLRFCPGAAILAYAARASFPLSRGCSKSGT